MVEVREASDRDFSEIWPFFRRIVSAGETYAYPRDLSEGQALDLWIENPRCTFVAVDRGRILGSYFLKTNLAGPGDHVCNCGYMVSPESRGKGLATIMCEHSQREAIRLGYQAMQFNSVVASNSGAVKLWTRLGFEIVGRVPKAFRHPSLGYVDTLIMYKWLSDPIADSQNLEKGPIDL